MEKIFKFPSTDGTGYLEIAQSEDKSTIHLSITVQEKGKIFYPITGAKFIMNEHTWKELIDLNNEIFFA